MYNIKSHPTMGAWIEIDMIGATATTDGIVAPHDGCVDWNHTPPKNDTTTFQSHPTMGAWIEIVTDQKTWWGDRVAPHDGCVDWNYTVKPRPFSIYSSHPTMGAWIEIDLASKVIEEAMSHPTMGAWIEIDILWAMWKSRFCRTPRWVRGLKFKFLKI